MPVHPALQPPRRRQFLLAAAALVFASTGCGYLRAEFARRDATLAELDRYTLAVSLDEAWKVVPEIRGMDNMWQGEFYHWRAVEGEPYKMITDSETETDKRGDERERTRTWFTCEGSAHGTGAQVRFFQHTHRQTFRAGKLVSDNESVDRRTDLEIELIRHFDPETADRIEREGERAAKAAG